MLRVMKEAVTEFKIANESIKALRAFLPDLEKAISIFSLRQYKEVVEAASARLEDDQKEYRLVHYFTFTPWEIYSAFSYLKTEVEGQRLTYRDLVESAREFGWKTEFEIEQMEKQVAKEISKALTNEEFKKYRQKFRAARQTLRLETKKTFGSTDLQVSLYNSTGLIDAMGYDSGVDLTLGTLINEPLRPSVLAAIDELQRLMIGQQENTGTTVKQECVGVSEESNDTRVKKGKQGPRRLSRQEKIEAYKQWQALDRDESPVTLEEWLEEKFGTHPDGSLFVASSTFYGWKKLVENS